MPGKMKTQPDDSGKARGPVMATGVWFMAYARWTIFFALAASPVVATAPASAIKQAVVPVAASGNNSDTAPPPSTLSPARPQMRNGTTDQGMITPPPVGDSEINKGVPPSTEYPTPVIPPPGSPGGNPRVQPK